MFYKNVWRYYVKNNSIDIVSTRIKYMLNLYKNYTSEII